MKDPMSLLGDLAKPLLVRCKKTGESPSKVCRAAIAAYLDEDVPTMPQGFAAMTANKADRARRRSAKTRRARSEG